MSAPGEAKARSARRRANAHAADTPAQHRRKHREEAA